MIAAGLRARITCLNPKVMERRFAGREFDAALLDELPASIDPCGERGEFHTCAYAGPMFTGRWTSALARSSSGTALSSPTCCLPRITRISRISPRELRRTGTTAAAKGRRGRPEAGHPGGRDLRMRSRR